jgi:hypothetical protein
MRKKTLVRLTFSTLLLVLLTTNVATGLSGGAGEVRAAGPWNAIIGVVRVGGALHRRNRVYEEAGATAPEINAYYDRLIEETQHTRREMIGKAAAGETDPRLVRAYTRLEAALKAEQDAAIQMIEAEKRQARREFHATLRREVIRILIASPSGQRILGQLREAVAGAQEAAKAVQIAAEEGRPIEALQEALAEKAGDIPLVQAAARQLGSAVGHEVDRAIDDVQTGMGEALDALEEINGELAAHDERERVPVSVVEDESLIAEVVPVQGVNAAADVAATAYVRAAEIGQAFPPSTSRDTMRDRVRGALLDARVQEIRDVTAGKIGQIYCTTRSHGEYRIAAQALGQTPQVSQDPAEATYLICHDIQTQVPVFAKVLGQSEEEGEPQEDATAEPSPTPEEEATTGDIPVGTYVGETNYQEVLDVFLLDSGDEPGRTTENQVVIDVAEDGTVTGSLLVKYSSGENNDELPEGPCTYVWHYTIDGTFSGQLGRPSGTLQLSQEWAESYTQTGSECIAGGDLVWVVDYSVDVEVSGDQMIGSESVAAGFEDDPAHVPLSFTATRQ